MTALRTGGLTLLISMIGIAGVFWAAGANILSAFAALAQRHIALVHSVALRHTANPQHAQDITQAVFIVLARKAAALGRKTVLPGWLYHTARLTAANAGVGAANAALPLRTIQAQIRFTF